MTVSTAGEKILVMGIMLVGVVTFSFAFGSLMSVLTNLDSRAAKLKTKSFELNSIRKKYRVSSDLYNKLFNALKFGIEQDENIEAFIVTLPTHLKTELMLAINNEIISKIPYFKEKSNNFCALAASFLKSSKIYMRDFIFQKGEPIYEIFFLLSGEAGYVVTDDNITVVFCKLKPGNLFGELDFFSFNDELPDGDRHLSVKAITDCELISLSKEALFELEKIYPTYIEEIFEFANFRLKKL